MRSTKPIAKSVCYTGVALGLMAVLAKTRSSGLYTYVAAAIFLLPIILFFSGLFRFRRTRAFVSEPTAKAFSHSGRTCAPRIVWIIFDEMDKRLAFDGRPKSLDLPTFDLLFRNSLVCDNAYPPSRCTEISIPALLTGALVKETIPYGNGNLALQYLGRDGSEPFQTQETIFHKMHSRQLNSGAIVGYHPLPKILGRTLVDAVFTAALTQANVLEVGFAESVYRCCRSLFETPSYSLFGTSLVGQAAANRYVSVIDRAEAMAGNPEIDFAFIHLPIPHAPYIFDRSSGIIGARRTRPERYLENLALADRSLSRILAAIGSCRREGAVIVTSDHWWRHAAGYDGMIDRRVPLAIHFVGQSGGCKYTDQLNTVSLHDLTLAITDRKVKNAHEAEYWLKTNASAEQPTKL